MPAAPSGAGTRAGRGRASPGACGEDRDTRVSSDRSDKVRDRGRDASRDPELSDAEVITLRQPRASIAPAIPHIPSRGETVPLLSLI